MKMEDVFKAMNAPPSPTSLEDVGKNIEELQKQQTTMALDYALHSFNIPVTKSFIQGMAFSAYLNQLKNPVIVMTISVIYQREGEKVAMEKLKELYDALEKSFLEEFKELIVESD